jgi:hypothetical protein
MASSTILCPCIGCKVANRWIEEALQRAAQGNSAPVAAVSRERESVMGEVEVGFEFETGNSVVAELPAGALLEVTGESQLTVVELPIEEVEEDVEEVAAQGALSGARIQSKYGPGTVVRLSSRLKHFDTTGLTLYIADGTDVVRILKS